MKNKIENEPVLKPITFMVPAHIAELIESTRGQLGKEWTEWSYSTALQAFEQDTFKQCVIEFNSLFIDGNFDFEDEKDEQEFCAPIIRALKKAWEAEKALRGEAVAA